MVTSNITVNAIDSGWYDETGQHTATNTNYIAGDLTDKLYNNFFVFDLPTFPVNGDVISAQLEVNTFNVVTNEASENYRLWLVSTPIATLRAGGAGLIGIYNDLGGGIAYGNRVISDSEDNKVIPINLNASAISDINFYGGSDFAIGGSVQSAFDDYLFGSSNLGANVKLKLTIEEPTPTITIDDLKVNEGDFAFVKVSLSDAISQPVTVKYQTTQNTAISNVDYANTTGFITFNPFETSKIISVKTIEDFIDEPNEDFYLDLYSPVNATIADSRGIVTIVDDDEPIPLIFVDDVSIKEGNAGVKSLKFKVSLDQPTGNVVKVDYKTADNTATGDEDYITKQNTLTFAPGTTQQFVDIKIIGDLIDEGVAEDFFLNLSNPSNGIIADSQGIGTIIDDDRQFPNISIKDVRVKEGNNGVKNFKFEVNLNQASLDKITVNYKTGNGSAKVNSDYLKNNGTITFNPGQTKQFVNVKVIGDKTFEADETFLVNLSNAKNANIIDNQGVGTILNDDKLPLISINDVSQTEGNSGVKNFNFKVSLNQAYSEKVTVKVKTGNDTAKANQDYITAGGTLTFNPGQKNQTFSVKVIGDTVVEDNETFFVNLSTPKNAIIADNQGLGTINNDDTLRISNLSTDFANTQVFPSVDTNAVII